MDNEVDVTTMLGEELKKELQEMCLQNPNDAGYVEATDRLAKLYKLKIEEKQVAHEIEMKDREASVSRRDWWIKLGLDIVGFAAPLIFYGVWMNRGLEFEKTGSFTSGTFRGLFSRFRPTR